jgi:xanthine dehydrogenase iron-sulfur cluster and FAD-binding subunit A
MPRIRRPTADKVKTLLESLLFVADMPVDVALLARSLHVSEEEVEKGLGGNLCRCGTYMGVRAAVLEAAKATKGGSPNA